MVGESGTSRNKNVHHYYKCVSAKNRKGCNKKTVRKVWIENLVIDQILNMLINDEILDRITDMVLSLQKQENTILPLLQKQLKQKKRVSQTS